MTPSADHLTSNFFVLRTPALPIEDLLDWCADLEAFKLCDSGAERAQIEQQWQQDVQTLRHRLRQIVDRPEVRHALFVASPSLKLGLDYWIHNSASKKGIQAERALVRYFTRMCARSTPFGLFSGCSVGRTVPDSADGSVLKLRHRGEYRVCSGLDFDYLWQLSAALCVENGVSSSLRYRPNSSLHRFVEVWRYLGLDAHDGSRKYQRMQIEHSRHLLVLLQRAQGGAQINELVKALSARGDISEEDATTYVRHLIDRQVLVPDFGPCITGNSAIRDLIAQVEQLPFRNGIADTLRWTRDSLAELDREGVGLPPEKYCPISERLEKLPVKTSPSDLYQVDLIKPVEQAILTKTVFEELRAGVEVLRRLCQKSEPDALQSFRAAFSYRYDRAIVPLLEALDEESGIGFGSSDDCAPLIQELQIESKSASSNAPLNAFLLQKVIDWARQPSTELELALFDLPPIGPSTPALPDSFAVLATLLARSGDALYQNDFRLKIEAVWGPDGARYLARFCHGDAELEHFVREHLKQEEACNPEAVYAEIVHLPEERMGNILHRPVLRDYEIVYLGRSGARPEQQLPASDLLLGVEKGRFVLYSQRLGRQIVPRLTSAHGYMNPQLDPVYRFLCLLQRQGGTHIGRFSWGALSTLRFLPRLRIGRLIVTPAQWRLTGQEIHMLGEHEGSRRFMIANKLRGQYGWPRWMVLQDADQSLPVDFENPLSIDAFIHVIKRQSRALLQEMLPAPEDLCVSGPEGRFCHELYVPFVRCHPVAAKHAAAAVCSTVSSPNILWKPDTEIRHLPPGSNWLYMKVYGGHVTVDKILIQVLSSLIQTVNVSGAIASWFFLRFSDPHHHLRIRFYGDPDRVRLELLPLIHSTLNPLLASGKIWKIQFDTYEQEIERYGGVAGMSAAEKIFFADSSAVLDVLQALHSSGYDPDRRWKIALLGSDMLLSDLGFDLHAKRALMEALRHKYASEFRATGDIELVLGKQFRAKRSQLEQLWCEAGDAVPGLVRQAFQTRSSRVLPLAYTLHSLFQEGKLTVNLAELGASFVHMHINRMMQSSWRQYECVLYEFLYRLYQSRLARLSKEPNSPE